MSNQGQNQKKEPNLLLMAIGFLIIGFGIVILLRGIRINVDTSEVLLSEDGVQTVNSTDFTLIEEETHGERLNDGTYVIEGKLRQEIEGGYTGLMIAFDLLDKKKKKVRETSGWLSSEYLGDNIWAFKVSGNDADGVVTDYRLSSCYGY